MKKLILSDVDGTLLKGSLVLQHAVMLHNLKIIYLGELPQRWIDDKKNEDLIGELSGAYRNALIGLKLKDLKVKEFIDEMMDEDQHTSALENILKSNNSRVILISGSPDFLVVPFAERLSLSGIQFDGYGSSYDAASIDEDTEIKFTGKILPLYNAESKRHMLKILSVKRYYEIESYGDTASDIPLFEVSQKSYLINPTIKNEKIVKYLLPNVSIIKDEN